MFKKYITKWYSKTPTAHVVIKKISTFIAIFGGAIIMAYNELPQEFKNVIPNNLVIILSIIALITRTNSGLKTIKDEGYK